MPRDQVAPPVASNIQMAALVDILPLGLVITDDHDQPIVTNQALTRLFSYDSNKSLACQLEETIKLSELSRQCRHSQTGCQAREINFGQRWLRIIGTPIHSGGQTVGTVVLVDDITSHKLWERSREDFFAIASHELRTPLTAIRGNIALIRDYFGETIQKTPGLAEIVSDMHTASIRLISIVNDFLDASRLEQNRLDFQLAPFNLLELMAQVMGEIKKLPIPHGVSVSFKPLAAKDCLVRADRERVRQVLLNLCSNAIKHTERGGITLTCTPDPKMLKITIKDTGKGIPVALQHLLFRKFQQASATTLTRDRTQGTGMGLYISKLLVEKMSGRIWLEESTPGRGSTFAFTLPRVIR